MLGYGGSGLDGFIKTRLHYLPSTLDESAVDQFFWPIFLDWSPFPTFCLLPKKILLRSITDQPWIDFLEVIIQSNRRIQSFQSLEHNFFSLNPFQVSFAFGCIHPESRSNKKTNPRISFSKSIPFVLSLKLTYMFSKQRTMGVICMGFS